MFDAKSPVGGQRDSSIHSVKLQPPFRSLWLTGKTGLSFFAGVVGLAVLLLLTPLAPMKFPEAYGAASTFTWTAVGTVETFNWTSAANWGATYLPQQHKHRCVFQRHLSRRWHNCFT